jgi:FkbM family methyltransferase
LKFDHIEQLNKSFLDKNMILEKMNKLFKLLKNKNFLKTLLHSGVAASVEHTKVFKNLKKTKFLSIIDIGANRGQFALIARNYYPNANIISFEPLEEPAKTFRHIFNSDSNTLLYENALGPIHKKMEIHISKQDDSSSLLPISGLQNDIFPGTAEKETRTVEVKTLDEILSVDSIKQPALLKVDVQGFEIDVLKGCESLLPLFEYIYVECSFVELYVGQSLAHEIISFLRAFKFALTGIYNLSYSKQGFPIQGDFLFKNMH